MLFSARPTASLWADLARGRLRLDRLSRNGDGSTFFPLAAPIMPRRIAAHFPTQSALGSLVNGGLSFQPAILCESLVGIGDLVESSDALGIVPLTAVTRMQKRPGIAVLPFEAPWLCAEQAVMWRRDRMPHPALKTFRDAARRCEQALNGNSTATEPA